MSLKSFPLWITYLLQFFHRFEHGSIYVVRDVSTFASDDLPNGGFLVAPHGAQCHLQKNPPIFLYPLYFTSSCTEDYKHIKFEYGYLWLLSTPSLPHCPGYGQWVAFQLRSGIQRLSTSTRNFTITISHSEAEILVDSLQRLNIDRWVCSPTLTSSNYGNIVSNRNGLL